MMWRLIDSDIADPYFVTAADDAISSVRREGITPDTIHFYRRDSPCISVGRSRRIKDDVVIDECIKNNVKIIRRSSGGGTIYTDEKCLVYAFVFERICKNKPQVNFKDICSIIVDALKKLEINASYKKPNDVCINDKKISGNAQLIKDNIVLIHGTIIVDSNLDLMNNVLIGDLSNVSSLYRECNIKTTVNDLKKVILIQLSNFFNIEVKKDGFISYEIEIIKNLMDKKYKNDSWNYQR